MLRVLASLLLFGGLGAIPVQAHQIESALNYLNGELELSSSFSNGEPTILFQTGTGSPDTLTRLSFVEALKHRQSQSIVTWEAFGKL